MITRAARVSVCYLFCLSVLLVKLVFQVLPVCIKHLGWKLINWEIIFTKFIFWYKVKAHNPFGFGLILVSLQVNLIMILSKLFWGHGPCFLLLWWVCDCDVWYYGVQLGRLGHHGQMEEGANLLRCFGCVLRWLCCFDVCFGMVLWHEKMSVTKGILNKNVNYEIGGFINL